MSNLIEKIQEPEAEIALVAGECKVVQTKRTLTRVVVSNPLVADVELLADQPEARLLNVTGKSFGTTSLTLWDESDRPVSFLVRVTVDSKELETRVNQAFPGAQVKVRQVGSQIILDGQVPEAKMMSDILQVVQAAIRTSPGFRARGWMGGGGAMGGAGGGMAGGAGGMGGGMGGGGGGMGGGMGGGGGGMGGGMGLTIINRVVIPGPRQVLLHVKIAELNRQALRQIGVSWLDTKGQSIIGSSAGGIGSGRCNSQCQSQPEASNPIGLLSPVTSTFNATGTASSGGQLFGVFNSGHFSLFINALRANSLAKVLAEPNLVALDGQPARFLVGGNFPYPVPQSSSIPGGTAVVTIQFARFGTILNFIPQILANDVIRLDVEPVVSNLDSAIGTTINGSLVPGIAERSARTVVELREGQTLAIAGLIQIQTTATSNRIPGLGDLPLVGPWFSNISDDVDRDRDGDTRDPRARRAARQERGDGGARRSGLSTQRCRVLPPGPDGREAGTGIPRSHRGSGPTPADEALPERAAVGPRTSWLCRLRLDFKAYAGAAGVQVQQVARSKYESTRRGRWRHSRGENARGGR